MNLLYFLHALAALLVASYSYAYMLVTAVMKRIV